MLLPNKLTKRVFLLLFVFLSANFPLKSFAQIQDSLFVEVTPSTVNLVEDFKHSTTRATLYSTFLPGLGQAYNKQYWKIPIIYTIAGVVTYFAVDNYRNAQKFKKEYKFMDNNELQYSQLPGYENYNISSIYNLYSSYQKNFELFIVLGGVGYLLNILDAYVFAHLFTFTINDDLTMRISPHINQSIYNPEIPTFGFRWSLTF